MSDTNVHFLHNPRIPFANYLGIALLVGVVLLLAWLQLEWLTELQKEEQARRGVALHVAATNYAEYLGQEMQRLLERSGRDELPRAAGDGEPLLEAVIELQASGPGRIRTTEGSGWQPVGRAWLLQRLGRPLLGLLEAGYANTGPQLWLDPPVIVSCPEGRCRVGLLDAGRLADEVLAPAASRMFADFGAALRSAVTIEEAGQTTAVLYPSDVHPDYVGVTDLEQPLLVDVPVLGPADGRWLLKVNHGGRTLEAAVAVSHVRNVLLSTGVLGLLVVSIALVVFNARRQVSLAHEHLFFVAGISHDLRTPLSVIASAADNLAARTVGEDPRVREYGELIQREVRRLRDMIENVLQFAQAASGTRPRVSVDIDMAALIDEVLDACATRLKDRALQLEVAGGLPLVRGDRAALSSALANLVINAAQYATGGNWIRIRAMAVRVRPRGRAVRISIGNPVAGRPVAHPGKLFEPFYRGRQAREAGITGTGIGLAVARHIAEQHGGGVSVDTAQPGVIRFTLLLPVHETHPAG